jgi:hypothetical protein
VFWNPKHGLSPFGSVVRGSATCAVIGALIAGCGTPYTKQDFVKRADGICLSTTRAVRSLTPPQFTGSAAQQQRSLSQYLGRVSPLVRAEARHLAALPKPPGRPAQLALLQRWLAAEHATASGIQVLAAAARGGNSEEVSAASSALAAVPVVMLASRYGVKDCAGPGATYGVSSTG